MRVVMLFLLILSVHSASAAKKTLAHFSPGEYTLSEGPEDKCVGGTFKISADGKYINFGSKHGFKTQTTSSVTKADIPPEEGCNYEARNKVETNENSTSIFSNNLLRCPEGTRRALSRVARISERTVELLIEEKDNPNLDEAPVESKYRCVFIKK